MLLTQIQCRSESLCWRKLSSGHGRGIDRNGRVRGGSWINNDQQNLRVGYRNNNNPDNRNNNIGFRVAFVAPPEHSLCGVKRFKSEFRFSRKSGAYLKGGKNQSPCSLLSSFAGLWRTEERRAPPVTRNRASSMASVIGGVFICV